MKLGYRRDSHRANSRRHLLRQRRPPQNRLHSRRRHHGSEHPADDDSNTPSAIFTGTVNPRILQTLGFERFAASTWSPVSFHSGCLCSSNLRRETMLAPQALALPQQRGRPRNEVRKRATLTSPQPKIGNSTRRFHSSPFANPSFGTRNIPSNTSDRQLLKFLTLAWRPPLHCDVGHTRCKFPTASRNVRFRFQENKGHDRKRSTSYCRNGRRARQGCLPEDPRSRWGNHEGHGADLLRRIKGCGRF